MASSSSSSTSSNSTLSEENWVLRTHRILEDNASSIQNIRISVCQVPSSISVINPQAYAPQVIALGPYHNLRPDLYHMERSKIEVVKSFWTTDQLNLVVEKLKEDGPKIRACYHKYLDLSDDTLALMLAVDGLFLIYLLSRDLNGFADDASVFSDVMMLENQIPMVLMIEIVNSVSLSGNDDAKLFSLMRLFCESQSPFELQPSQKDLSETKVLHLLDLLHKMIIPHENNDKGKEKLAGKSTKLSSQAPVSLKIDLESDPLVENFTKIVKTEVLTSIKPIQLITTLPWGMIRNLLGHSSNPKEDVTSNPLVKEIEIPSVSQLSKMAGIIFKPQNVGSTLETRFDKITGSLYLPVITLTANSEVILRNLVAYEIASNNSSNLLISHYLDIMSGIIDTKEDARLLGSFGIIKGVLTNTQVADLFNGMNKSSLKGYGYDTAAMINDYYENKMKVRVYSFVKKYVYKSWKVLTVISTFVLLLLLVFQSVCDVYDCKRFSW
ncbi:hypothetical protein QVD17_03220 [Tagetes erecta]|uniref:Uncharacterized protein n=1 Tax=Tagetes erecta TaxID=13708 RepID=A0AAD8L7Z6_TARER|nr:hypothetical protein QVD17_03220 [Tagetes erecta]